MRLATCHAVCLASHTRHVPNLVKHSATDFEVALQFERRRVSLRIENVMKSQRILNPS